MRRGGAGDKGEYGAVAKYAFLLEPGAPLPVTKAEALDLEARVRTWVLQGRPAITMQNDGEGIPFAVAQRCIVRWLRARGQHWLAAQIAALKDDGL